MTVHVKFVVDSTCDIPPAWLAKYDIKVVPIFINFDHESFPDDGIALPREAFYQKLASSKNLAGTSAPPPGLAQGIIQQQLDQAEHVVVFAVASTFSSVYNTMRLAAQNCDPTRTHVIDSGSLSMGIGWMVMAAAEAAAAGATLEEVLEAVKNARERTKLYAVLDTLEYVRRGGRINGVVASLGTILQIKPLVSVKDGQVHIDQRVRTSSRAIQGLVDLTIAQAPLERLAVLHTNAPEAVQKLRAQLDSIAPPETIVLDATPAFGVHIGPGCLGIALVRKMVS